MNASLWWVDTAKVHVLAEDEFTRALLVGVWDDVRLRVDVAGGGDAVGTLVEEARRSGANNVFGVVDRDFHVSAGWRGARVYRFERHEAENYLLDDDVLAARARVAPHEIAAETRRYVEACCGYMAARDTLWKLQASVTEGFPTAPRTPTPEHPFTLEEAIASMQTSPFLCGLQSRLRADWTDVALERTVTDAFTRFVRESADDTWRRTFSGKEILRHLRGHFARLSGTRGASASDNAADLATRGALLAETWCGSSRTRPPSRRDPAPRWHRRARHDDTSLNADDTAQTPSEIHAPGFSRAVTAIDTCRSDTRRRCNSAAGPRCTCT